ncbi:MAG: methyltransferase domain-containing protein [Bacteroidetes bacterium]|nr:methyltransferase domain-containing protein [Bacteroidota bacterium]
MNKNKNKNKIKNNFFKPSEQKSLSFDVYNDREFADSYSNKAEYNSHNALYERPAMLSMLNDIKGKKVLDAGCGPGLHSSVLIDRGADVTAVDYSGEMVRHTLEATEGKARVLQTDLNLPLDMFEDEEFDVVFSSLTVHYVNDWIKLFSEFNRILKQNGYIVFSTHHPFMDFSFHSDGNYFETELLTDDWPSYNVKMKFYRRSLGEIFWILKNTGFELVELSEPRPVKECGEKFPDAYNTLTRKPWFIIFKIKKSDK